MRTAFAFAFACAVAAAASLLAASPLGAEAFKPQREDGAASRMEELVSSPFHVKLGEREPRAWQQRYRRDEWPRSRPFFQWYYFWISDVDNELFDTHFAISLAVSECASGQQDTDACSNRRGAYATASVTRVDPSGVGAPHIALRTDRYGGEHFSAATDTQFARIVSDAAASNATDSGEAITISEVSALDDAGTRVRLRGHLRAADKNHVFRCVNCDGFDALDGTMDISFDLVLHRQFGWFGQDGLTAHFAERWKAIQWNTYAHSSAVDGEIVLNGRKYTFREDNPKQRAYADMNWGAYFPTAPPAEVAPDVNVAESNALADAEQYPWGWYYGGDGGRTSIIAGWGKMFMRGSALVGSVTAAFADVVMADAGIRIEVVYAADYGAEVTVTTDNDGNVQALKGDFTVERSNWQTWRDDLGEAKVPLKQVVTITTNKYVIELDFTCSTLGQFARLLFPHPEDGFFSDFEALGVPMRATVSDVASNTAIADFSTPNGGVEFGYLAKIHS